ncbi:MAG: hypothetical protein GWN64_07775 [Candidatus Thorarchaeota archaeon]|nr:hypothetical protein [Candidatus Thorarchaeota archaeon]
MKVISEGRRFRECVETYEAIVFHGNKKVKIQKSRTFHQTKIGGQWKNNKEDKIVRKTVKKED